MEGTMKKILILGVVVLFLAGCQQQTPAAETLIAETPAAQEVAAVEMGSGMGMGNGMGARSGMGGRHHAAVPEPYVGALNEVQADEESIQRGAVIYTSLCISCHGEDGMGTGPAGAELNPTPAPIARTSQMLGDAYLLWRISEGGVPFQTQMPVWKDTLSQQQIWDVVNYVRALGSGMAAGHGMGQQNEAQAQMHAEMLAKAIDQGIITQIEADIFTLVHDTMESYMMQNTVSASSSEERQAIALAALVEAGTLTQVQVDTFNSVHQRLLDNGFMQ
jgi:mono/diheme cytochrome c family protein